MAWEITNNWADIADLRISEDVTPSSFSTETELRLELRTSNFDLDLGDVRVFVGFHRMTLQLFCHGTEIQIGERYGDYTPTNDLKTKVAEETNVGTNVLGKGGVNITPATVMTGDVMSIAASAEAQRGTSEKRATEWEELSKYVTAKPNDKWEITTRKYSEPLSARYITPDYPLCVIRPKKNSNRTGVEAKLYAHKNDMVITTPDAKRSKFALLNPEKRNKERVFAVLLGKAIDEGMASERSSIVNLSTISSLPDDAE